MRIGILGGTFDPVHIGHLIIAESAREQLLLEKVLFVPAGQPWRKADRTVTPAEHRLAMLRLACRCNEAFEVSTVDMDREGPSYTVDTLEDIVSAHASADIFFVLGEDALADLPNWKSPDRIRALARLVIAPRVSEDASPLPTANDISLKSPLVSISSSDIRRRTAMRASIRYLVPAEVERYIAEHRLYRE